MDVRWGRACAPVGDSVDAPSVDARLGCAAVSKREALGQRSRRIGCLADAAPMSMAWAWEPRAERERGLRVAGAKGGAGTGRAGGKGWFLRVLTVFDGSG